MKKLLLILLLSTPCFAAGPKHSFEDPLLNDEFNNVYFDQANTFKKTIPSATFTSLSVSTITASSATITNARITNLLGTTTNDSASTGMVGEYVSSSVGATTITGSGVGQDITTISLTAGEWRVTGMVQFTLNTATWTQQLLYVATGEPGDSFSNSTSFTTQIANNASSATTPARVALTVANTRVSIASTTTIQMKVRAIFSAGSPQAEGSIAATRVR